MTGVGTQRRRLRPTFVPSRAARYRRPGGPWDRGSLESGFAQVRAPRPALVDDAGAISSAALESAVQRLAGRLRARGVRRGDVVAFQFPNCAAAVTLYRACWRIGAVAAPVHHKMGSAEVHAALSQVEPVLAVSAPDMPASSYPRCVVARAVGPADVEDAFSPAPVVRAGDVAVRGSDLAVVLFTSGSTGTPKAVMHTHRGLGYKAATMVKVHGLRGRDAVLMPAPLAHISGLLNGVLLPGAAGVPAVLMASWDPGRGLDLIEEHAITFMGAPPVFFSQMASSGSFAQERVRSLRLVSTGGASVSPAFVDSTADVFDCRVKRTYGSTEAPTVTTSEARDPLIRARETDGRPVGEVELSIRDPETGAPRRTGERGEIWLRGPELFVGYGDAGATAAAIARPGGWFRTGDVGVVDTDAWLQVVGRLSDTIIRGGENISASEVEAVLEAHPDVRHAVAVPFPDEVLGERVAAYVESAPTFDLDECRRWFARRGVTRFKTPEAVVRMEALPVLAAGKPDRAALRKLALELSA